jgi:hypothetical protein
MFSWITSMFFFFFVIQSAFFPLSVIATQLIF